MAGTSANSGPGWKKHPAHRIVTAAVGGRVEVVLGGEVIAASGKAVQLDEDGYPTRYYLPRADVRMDRLVRSSRRTYCPFKGHACYYSVIGGPENVAWSYESPYDEMTAIEELLAFYADKVDAIVIA